MAGTKIKHDIYPLKIAGMGYYRPNNTVLTNDIVRDYNDTDREKVVKLGVTERAWHTDETHTIMAKYASEEAVKDAGINVKNIDLIVNVSQTYEKTMPEPATMLQKKLGLGDSGIPCITIQSGELGFMAALDICSSYMATNRFNNIMIVSSEVFSEIIDVDCDKTAHALLSDEAAVFIVTNTLAEEKSCMWKGSFKCEPDIDVYNSKYCMRMFEKDIAPSDICIKINSDEFICKGIKLLDEAIDCFSKENTLDDVDVVIPQQINKAFADFINDKFSTKQVYNQYEKTAFSGSASIPAAFYNAVKSGMIKKGNIVLLVGISSGIESGIIKLIF